MSAPSRGETVTEPSVAPRRLHPGSIVIDLLRNLPQTLIALPALAGFVGRIGWGRVALVALVGVAISALVAWIKWRRFTYAVIDDAVVIESGLLSRNRRILPLDRVQDVDIERKLLQRVFGLARVSLETGGAGKDEAVLDSVSRAEAERLRGVVRRHGAAAPSDEPGEVTVDGPAEAAPDREAPVLFAMEPPRLLLFGLFNFSLVWMAVLFGALQYVDDYLPWDAFDPRDWVTPDRRAALAAQATVLVVLAAAALFAALGFVAGVGRTFVREAGFRLTDEGGRLRRVRGLLTRTEAVVALRRVQLALIQTGPLRAALGWSGLRFQTLGGSGDAGGRQEVAPFARDGEIDAVLAVTPIRRVDAGSLERVSSGHVVRALIRNIAGPAIGLTVLLTLFPPAWPVLAVVPFLIVAALLARRFHRYGRGDGQLNVARGVLRRRLWLVPERNIQCVTLRRSWLQRRLGVATVVADTAGAGGDGPRISDIAVDRAWAMAQALSTARPDAVSGPRQIA